MWCGNYGNSLSRIFGKNFVKVTVLLKKLLKSWFHEIFFGEREFLKFPHCVEVKLRNFNTLPAQLPLFYSKFFVKTMFFLVKKNITLDLFDGKIFAWQRNSRFYPLCVFTSSENSTLFCHFVKSISKVH